IERFDEDARDLPIAIKSAIFLAKRYGASVHATLRRYVERNTNACAVLVLERTPLIDGEGSGLLVKKVFQSPEFTRRFSTTAWPARISIGHPFAEPVVNGCRYKESGKHILADLNGDKVHCYFHLFDNSYNAFVLIFPADAKRHSR